MNFDKINSSVPLKTAVLFLVFNRPDTTSQVFEKIREVKPQRLYVASDGPRKGLEDEKEKIKKTREIATKIDWPCKVKLLFRNKNLGCKKAVSRAITWFFKYEEQGIILEDDCVPHLEFFSFCENLLDRYSKDERISLISGNNFQNGRWRSNGSYYFSKYPHIWGWASWRRAWKYYQPDIPFWSKLKNSEAWLKLIPDKIERQYWSRLFNIIQKNQIDSWAYPWVASIWFINGLTVTPNVNLVSNIGFGKNATHTKKEGFGSNIPTQALGNIIHPKIIEINFDADKYDFEWTFGGRNLKFPRSWAIILKRILYFIARKFS